MKKIVALTLMLALMCLIACGLAENETTELFVTATQLNGRAYPTKKSSREAFFDYGEWIVCTGKWSQDHQWVEITGGETGTVWCKIDYLTERPESFMVTNENNGPIKIRSKPVDGKVVGYLRKGKQTEIAQVILGWGKCKKGWIDLDYVIEEE